MRLSHGIDAKSLSDDEVEAWLGDPRTMSEGALRRLRKDEMCPIQSSKVGGRQRIPERSIQRHLEMVSERPEALKQI